MFDEFAEAAVCVNESRSHCKCLIIGSFVVKQECCCSPAVRLHDTYASQEIYMMAFLTSGPFFKAYCRVRLLNQARHSPAHELQQTLDNCPHPAILTT
jgi:hypothetical protein